MRSHAGLNTAFTILLLLGIFATAVSAQEGFPRRERLTRANVSTLSRMAMLPLPGASQVAWSPGGSRLVIVAGSRVYLHAMNDLNGSPRILDHAGPVRDIDFSADGQELYALVDGLITVWSLVDGGRVDTITLQAREFALGPDGDFMAYISRTGNLHVLDVRFDEDTRVLEGNFTSVDFAPNGDAVVTAELDGTLTQWSTLDRSTQRLMTTFRDVELGEQPSGAYARLVRYSDNSRLIASGGWGVFQVRDNDGRQQYNPTVEPGVMFTATAFNVRAGLVGAVSQNPSNGSQNRMHIWDVNTGSELFSVQHPGIQDFAFSPDGILVASVGGGYVWLWTTEAGLPTLAQASTLSSYNVLAACDTFGVKPSGLVPFQSISLVWSWFADTEDLIDDHLNAVRTSVILNGRPLSNWQYLTRIIDDPVNDGNPTIYFVAPIGELAAGNHSIIFTQEWVRAISDGFDDYGPGTANQQDVGGCEFVINAAP